MIGPAITSACVIRRGQVTNRLTYRMEEFERQTEVELPNNYYNVIDSYP